MGLSLPMPKVGIENPGVAAPGFLLRVQMDTLLLFACYNRIFITSTSRFHRNLSRSLKERNTVAVFSSG